MRSMRGPQIRRVANEPGERAAFSARLISPPADGALVAVKINIAQDKASLARSQPMKRAP